jgi:uncharacterized protein (TIGR03435 family)
VAQASELVQAILHAFAARRVIFNEVRTLWNYVTILLLAQGSALAQPTPSFDVAYVKALPAELHGGDFQVTPTSVSFDRFPLGFMIRWAYGLHPYQAFETAGPNWLEPGLGCVRFTVIGKVDRPVPVEQLRLMLRTLLTERLKLSLHRGTKEMTVAVVSVGKDGPKLHASEESEMSLHPEGDGDLMHFKGALMSRLDEWLYIYVPYLVVDETGLPGRYDFDLNVDQYRDLANPPLPGSRIDLAPGVNKALQPLGLKLELKRRPVEVLIIDHAEKVATEN